MINLICINQVIFNFSGYGNATVHSNSTTLVSMTANYTSQNDTDIDHVGQEHHPTQSVTSSSPLPNISITATSPMRTTSPKITTTISTNVSMKGSDHGGIVNVTTTAIALVSDISKPLVTSTPPRDSNETSAVVTGGNSKSRRNETTPNTSSVPNVDVMATERPHRHGNGQKNNKNRDSHRKHHHRSTPTPIDEGEGSDIGEKLEDGDGEDDSNHQEEVLIEDVVEDVVHRSPTVSSSQATTTNYHQVIANNQNTVNDSGDEEDEQSKHRRPKYLDPSHEFLGEELLSAAIVQRTTLTFVLVISLIPLLVLEIAPR